MDSNIRQLDRDAAVDPTAKERAARARCRAGLHCHCLKSLLTAEEQANLVKIIYALRGPMAAATKPEPFIHVRLEPGSPTDLASRLSELVSPPTLILVRKDECLRSECHEPKAPNGKICLRCWINWVDWERATEGSFEEFLTLTP